MDIYMYVYIYIYGGRSFEQVSPRKKRADSFGGNPGHPPNIAGNHHLKLDVLGSQATSDLILKK